MRGVIRYRSLANWTQWQTPNASCFNWIACSCVYGSWVNSNIEQKKKNLNRQIDMFTFDFVNVRLSFTLSFARLCAIRLARKPTQISIRICKMPKWGRYREWEIHIDFRSKFNAIELSCRFHFFPFVRTESTSTTKRFANKISINQWAKKLKLSAVEKNIRIFFFIKLN